MPGLDTNVLVRWLVADDESQLKQTSTLFQLARDEHTALNVPSTVALELEWVLRSRYKFPKDTIVATFAVLLETQELNFQQEPALERALHLYRQNNVDFADCIHASLCSLSGQGPLLTFDKQAARLNGVELVGG